MMTFRLAIPTILLFILSGLTSLVYEVIWIRVISFAVGSTSTSMSIVLSIFFLGLSVGSYISGKYSYKLKKAIFSYGALEGLIGIYSFFLIYGLLHFHQILAYLPIENSFGTLAVFVKFFIVFIFLFPPTIAMGASLPILVKLFHKNHSQSGKKISLLYGINTLGAALGAFLTSFSFIPHFGILETNHMMAIVNIFIFIASYFLQKMYDKKFVQGLEESGKEEKTSFVPRSQVITKWQRRAIYFVCGGVGFASISGQVVWNKYLGVFFGTNIYGLGLILSLYLIGMAIGGLLLSLYIEKIEHKFKFLCHLLFLTLFFIFSTSFFLDRIPYLTYLISSLFNFKLEQLLLKTIAGGVLLFIPTILFGTILPLAVNILSPDGKSAEKEVGVLYSINTIGSIIGSYLTGIILLPLYGSSQTIAITLFIFSLVLISYTMMNLRRGDKAYKTVVVISSAIILMIAFKTPALTFQNIIKSAYFNYKDGIKSYLELSKSLSKDTEKFKFIYEGKTAITSLSHESNDILENSKDEVLRLKTNGLNESVYYKYDREVLPKYESLLGLLPYLFAENPQNVFVVGYGGGYTVDLLSKIPLPLVQVVELEQGIIDAAQFIHDGKNPILSRENVKVDIEDARFALTVNQFQNKNKKYDIIVSQPSHSWLSGVANLFTLEYFNIVKNNLSEKGIFSQWLNLYNMDRETLKSILKSFYTVFPEGIIFNDRGDDELIMLGSKSELKLRNHNFYNLSNKLDWKKYLAATGNKSIPDLISNYLSTRASIWLKVRNAPINTDINAYAEVRQTKLFYNESYKRDIDDFLSENFSGDFKNVINLKNEYEFKKKMAFSYIDHKKVEKFDKIVFELEKEAQRRKDYSFLGKLALHLERYASVDFYLRKSLEINPNSDNLNDYLFSKVSINDFDSVIEKAKYYSKLNNKLTECYVIYAHVFKESERADKLIDKLLSEYELYEKKCASLTSQILGLHYRNKRNYHTAIVYLENYYNQRPADLKALKILLESYINLNDHESTEFFARELHVKSLSEKKRLLDLADYYEALNLKDDGKKLKQIANNY